MQVRRTEPARIQLLTCGACCHWQETINTNTDEQPQGRCMRFGEVRAAEMRPRCNICWEPQESLHNHQSLHTDMV